MGVIRVAQRLGRDNLLRYAHDFGFGDRTGVALPGESKGILRPVSESVVVTRMRYRAW